MYWLKNGFLLTKFSEASACRNNNIILILLFPRACLLTERFVSPSFVTSALPRQYTWGFEVPGGLLPCFNICALDVARVWLSLTTARFSY